MLTGAWAAVVAAAEASLRCSFALASISDSCARALLALHTQGRGFMRLHAMREGGALFVACYIGMLMNNARTL